jgi:hypothetical protein
MYFDRIYIYIDIYITYLHVYPLFVNARKEMDTNMTHNMIIIATLYRFLTALW